MRHIISLALLIASTLSWVQSSAQSIVILDCIQDSFVLCAPDQGFSLPDNNQIIVGVGAPGATSCSGHVLMPLNITDSCGIIIRFVVDLIPFDGSDTVRLQDTSDVFLDFNDEARLVLDSKLFGTSPINLNGIAYNEACPDDPGGFHRLLWTVMDGCGDLVVCDFLLRLEDCVSPNISVVGLDSVVMPSSMEFTVSAQDFVSTAVDDCSPENWILHSFDSLNFTPTKTFTCASIDENGGPTFFIPLWSADAGVDNDCNGAISWGERNLTRSNTFIIIEQNGQCEPEEPFGRILSENQVPIQGVIMIISDSLGTVIQVVLTDADGFYDPGELNLSLMLSDSAAKAGDDSVGVSTLDLIKIQKHLLGIEPFDSPYKYIAADANNTESVSAADLLELRKLILRINHKHPNNESWRFVPASFVFTDPTDPWPFDESIMLTDNRYNNFVAVKIGDLNGTVTQASVNAIGDGTSLKMNAGGGPLVFEINNQLVSNGEIIEIEFTGNNLRDVIGFQFTLQVNGLSLLNVLSGKINIASEQFAVHESAMTCSWFDLKSVTAGRSDVLFTVVAKATKDGQLKEMLNLNSSLTSAESYFQKGGVEIISEIQLSVKDKTKSHQDEYSPLYQRGGYFQNHYDYTQVNQNRHKSSNAVGQQSTSQNSVLSLYQNEPNPFKSETTIPFAISETGKVSLQVFDALGREVYFSSHDFPAGRNAFRINWIAGGQTGVMYYRVEKDGAVATRKMIVIQL